VLPHPGENYKAQVRTECPQMRVKWCGIHLWSNYTAYLLKFIYVQDTAKSE